jgi:hypothetical protein
MAKIIGTNTNPDEQDQGRTEQDGQLDPLAPRAALLRRGGPGRSAAGSDITPER